MHTSKTNLNTCDENANEMNLSIEHLWLCAHKTMHNYNTINVMRQVVGVGLQASHLKYTCIESRSESMENDETSNASKSSHIRSVEHWNRLIRQFPARNSSVCECVYGKNAEHMRTFHSQSRWSFMCNEQCFANSKIRKKIVSPFAFRLGSSFGGCLKSLPNLCVHATR